MLRNVIQSITLLILIVSAWPTETNNINFERLNRRIEHITKLHADSSKRYSEAFMVRFNVK